MERWEYSFIEVHLNTLRPNQKNGGMTDNLLRDRWADLDSGELRLLLNERIRGPGQYDGHSNNPNKLYLPLVGSSCRIGLTFRDKKVIAIEARSVIRCCRVGAN
jgi:hypothetical protein